MICQIWCTPQNMENFLAHRLWMGRFNPIKLLLLVGVTFLENKYSVHHVPKQCVIFHMNVSSLISVSAAIKQQTIITINFNKALLAFKQGTLKLIINYCSCNWWMDHGCHVFSKCTENGQSPNINDSLHHSLRISSQDHFLQHFVVVMVIFGHVVKLPYVACCSHQKQKVERKEGRRVKRRLQRLQL